MFSFRIQRVIPFRFHAPVRLVLAAGLLVGFPAAHAFPPAPYYTVFGNVRDQYGKLLPSQGISVVAYAGLKKLPNQPLLDVPSGDYNYQMRLRMDMTRPDTVQYHPHTVEKDALFNLRVAIGDRMYLPIEMGSAPSVGAPGDRRRLDLTLGVDSDGDGLPDAWEEAQLYQAGERPGPEGWNLGGLDRDGDYDGDGTSNWHEYLAGTYAVDASSVLDLRILEITSGSARLEFYSFYGKSYTLQSSTDLKTWTPVSFTLVPPAEGGSAESQSSLVATTTGPTSLFVAATGNSLHYRLLAR